MENNAVETCCNDGTNDGDYSCKFFTNNSIGKLPQGRRTAFSFFVDDCSKNQPQLIENNNNIKSDKFAKDCAHKWKVLPVQEKTLYYQLSKYDKIRYEREIQEYKTKVQIQTNRPIINTTTYFL